MIYSFNLRTIRQMLQRLLPIIGFAVLSIGIFFFFNSGNEFQVSYGAPQGEATEEPVKPVVKNVVPEPPKEVPNQKPLANPPSVIKAVYATSWSAGSVPKMNYLINLIKKTELNAIVIDIKDYSGIVSYDIEVPEVKKYGAKEIRIPKINELIKRLHDEGIYVIARLTVFQDPLLAKARPNLAIKNATTGAVWKDNKGIAWIDPSSMEAWDYTVSIAKNAAEHGFDEINFDYVRFPSDGNLKLMQFPFYDIKTTLKSQAMRSFFQYLRKETAGIKISADLFGLATVDPGDLGIGQIIEYGYENFDYIAPMIYPSHYASGFSNFKNPADHPYEVIERSMRTAYQRLIAFNKKVAAEEVKQKSLSQVSNVPVSPQAKLKVISKLRPWLQDFNLGATYDAAKVKAQIKATTEAYCNAVGIIPPATSEPSDVNAPLCDESLMEEVYNGWMLWDPRNNYTAAALTVE